MAEEPTANTVTRKDWYKYGSEACKQYSQLTMNIRTLAQQLVLAYAVGMGIVISKGPSGLPTTESSEFCPISVWAGAILIIFAFVLYVLNRHHSSAFRTIRDDCLRRLEGDERGEDHEPIGPWAAHARARERWQELFKPGFNLAWDLPFYALLSIGIASVVLGSCDKLP
jgi:hypothetical protein